MIGWSMEISLYYFKEIILDGETFADAKIREIYIVCVHKLSRMGAFNFFREHKLSQMDCLLKFLRTQFSFHMLIKKSV